MNAIPPDWSNAQVREGTHRMLALRSERITAGDRAIGWKLGFGAPQALARFGLSAPLVGFLTDATVHTSGSTVPCATWKNAVAEPEVAVYIGSEVRPDDVASSIAGLGAAIELADIDPPPDDLSEVLAGDIFHRAVILGEPDMNRDRGDRTGLRARVWHDDSEVVDTPDFQELTGDIIDVVGHAADLLAAAGVALAAGDIIIAGSITPPIAIAPGQEVRFELAPLASISVCV